MRGVVWMMMFLCASVSCAEGLDCMEHCKAEACSHFNGNLTAECGSCDDTASCHPGSPDFDSWHTRREENQTLIEEDKLRDAAMIREEL